MLVYLRHLLLLDPRPEDLCCREPRLCTRRTMPWLLPLFDGGRPGSTRSTGRDNSHATLALGGRQLKTGYHREKKASGIARKRFTSCADAPDSAAAAGLCRSHFHWACALRSECAALWASSGPLRASLDLPDAGGRIKSGSPGSASGSRRRCRAARRRSRRTTYCRGGGRSRPSSRGRGLRPCC